MKPSDIGKYVHLKTMERLEACEGDYWQCFHAVLDADPELKSIYAGTSPATVKRGPAIKPKEGASHEAGSEIDKLVKRFMHQMNITDYSWALTQVLKANPQLTKRYSQV